MKREHVIAIESAACVGCGLCRKDCPAGNIELENKTARVLSQSCILCGHCVAICPKAAVSISGFDGPPVEIDGTQRLNPLQLLAALRERRSVRQFTSRPVASDTLKQIIEAGRLTPTGGNAQNVSYIVLRDGAAEAEATAVRLFRKLRPLAKLTNPAAGRVPIDDHFFFKKAPAVIAVVSRNKVNGALAASNMALMAEACGLGVLYSGFFALAANSSPALRRQLQLQRGDKVVTALVLGYSGVNYHRTAQKETATVNWT